MQFLFGGKWLSSLLLLPSLLHNLCAHLVLELLSLFTPVILVTIQGALFDNNAMRQPNGQH